MEKVEGVHWFWWVLWLLVFWPALIIVAIVHGNKKKEIEHRNAQYRHEQLMATIVSKQ